MAKLIALGRITILLALLASAPAQAQDFPREWHWIRVVPSDTKAWDVQQSAKAEVTFTRDGFLAKLYDDDAGPAGDPDIILKGRIRGRHVTAVATQLDTDAGPWTLRGTVAHTRTRLKDASNGWGEDRIALVAGNEFIGLTRAVRSGAPSGR